MINILFWSVLVGLFRAIHGSGNSSRIWLLIAASIAVVTCYNLSIATSILAIIGLIFMWVPGWGKYLSTVGSGKYHPDEEEIAIIDVILKSFPEHEQPVIGMCLRWAILSLPLALVLHNPWMLGLFSIGLLYFIHRYHKNWVLTEGGTGTVAMFLVLIGSL